MRAIDPLCAARERREGSALTDGCGGASPLIDRRVHKEGDDKDDDKKDVDIGWDKGTYTW